MNFLVKGSVTKIVSRFNLTRFLKTSSKRLGNPHEPEYLELLKPPLPVYDLLNIQIKGYDFTIVEHYSRYIHHIAKKMNIKVVTCWATPNQSLEVSTFKPCSTSVLSLYKIKLYERNVQVENLPSVKTPLFIEVIQKALPEGTTLSFVKHMKEIEENLYIPDFELETLKQELEDIKNPKSHGGKKT